METLDYVRWSKAFLSKARCKLQVKLPHSRSQDEARVRRDAKQALSVLFFFVIGRSTWTLSLGGR